MHNCTGPIPTIISILDQLSGPFQTDSGPTRCHGHCYDAQTDAENVYIRQHRVHRFAVEHSLATAIRNGQDQVFEGSSEEIEGRPSEIDLINCKMKFVTLFCLVFWRIPIFFPTVRVN